MHSICRSIKTVYLFLFAIGGVTADAASVTVTATRLDGTSVAGELSRWEDAHVSLATNAGDVRIETRELASLRWPAPLPVVDQPKSSVLVELIDGTVLPARQFSMTGAKSSVMLEASLPAEQLAVEVPLRRLAAVQLQALDGDIRDQWQEIRSKDYTSDVLVVLKRDGKSLDYVEGVLGDITADKIEFKLDDDMLRIARAKVAGFISFRADKATQSEPHCILRGRSGLRASAAHVDLAGSLVHVTTTGETQFDWPLDDLQLADFSAGKVLYLSDIGETTVRCTPVVGLPADAILATQYVQPRRDRSAYGGPLSLLRHDGEPADGAARATPFNKGLALRSRTEMVFRLPAGFRRLAAMAGIEPATSSTGNVQLNISGDDRSLFAAEIAGDGPPHEIDLDITDVKRLKIVVDYGTDLDVGDWLNLCDARIVK